MTLDVNVDSERIELQVIDTCYNCKDFSTHWEPSDGYYCNRYDFNEFELEPNNKCKYWSKSDE